MRKIKLSRLPWHMIPYILGLAGPTMLEQLMQTAVQYIDTAMVGSLGTQATAAVGATTTINWLIGGTISALGIGFLSYIARAYGANNRSRAARVTAQAAFIVLVSGIFFTALPLSLSRMVPIWMQVDESIAAMTSRYFFILYSPMLFRAASIIFGTALRAAGDTKTPMKIGVWVNIINVALNFLLIYPARPVSFMGLTVTIPGAGLGVEGAALASAVSFTVGGILTTRAVWRHPVISPRSQRILPDWKVLAPCLRVSLPSMLQRFGTSLGYVAFAAMINSLGEISTAAHTIANTVESAFYIPAFGMQTAAAMFSGNALGAKDNQRMRDITHMIVAIEIMLMTVTGGLLFLSAPLLVRLFTSDAGVIALSTTVLRMVAVSEPIYGVAIALEGVMEGVGKTGTPFVFNITGMWGVRIVGTFICTRLLGLGLISAWACMIAHNVLLFILYLTHYLRGRWNPLAQR